MSAPGICVISQAEFTAVGRRFLGDLWEEGQEAYEAHWLGAASPQRTRGELILLGWVDGAESLEHPGAEELSARLALWKAADGNANYFFLYARDAALAATRAAEFPRAALEYAREWGMPELEGPIAFSTWHPYRFVSRRGDADFFPGEQKLPEEYHQDFLAAGFQVVAEYQSTWVEDLAESIRTGLAMGVDRALGKVKVEVLDKDRLPQLLPELHRLSCDIFKDNFGYSPLGLPEFLALASSGKGGESALIMASAGGKPAGFVFSYAIGPYSPGPGRPAVEACVLKTLGVHPEFRSLGLGYGLSYLTHKHWLEQGKTAIIHAYMKTDNHSRSMSSHFGGALRDYALVRSGR